MKKILFWLCLLCTIHLSAQDRILTLKQDTLKAKVNSIDKQKVVYYLEADADKKLQDMPVADLHKIIWRTGQEYIINQAFEDSLKKLIKDKALANSVINHQKTEQKPQLSEEKKAPASLLSYIKAPELCVRRWVLWRTYKVNGTRVSKYTLERTIAKYDSETYEDFRKGHELWNNGAKLFSLSAMLVGSRWIISSTVLSGAVVVVGIILDAVTIVYLSIGNRDMRAAILNYEAKRLSNSLKLKTPKSPF
jgi:hypothetical protein